MLPLRAAINKAKKENKVVRKENVRVDQNGQTRRVNLEVVPLKNLKQRCYLIFFEETQGPKAERPVPSAPSQQLIEPGDRPRAARLAAKEGSRRIAELEEELNETRDFLQSLQEQSEAANEKIQAANEEVTSANEELQSINEELETSKEELESANEELTTINEEMTNRNAELNRVNSDLVNLQTSAHLAILLLGRDLTIRRFSSQAEKRFHLLATDLGRPISGVRHNLDVPDLERFIAEAVDTVRERKREVRDNEGRWYSLRVRPYLTQDNKVDGAVLVLVDIDAERGITEARKQAEEALRRAQKQLTERAGQLEQAVAERTEELTATNHQLEAFIYSIAHDLRAPLRTMQGFSELLVLEAGAALSEKGRDFAHRISKAAQFMDALLADLLDFSRIAQQQASVNLETVVRSALSRLENDIQEKKAQLEVLQPWPAVLAHNPTLGQVLFNLVSNALKFVAPGMAPLVRLRAEERGRYVRVWVEDNGIGIAHEHVDQIFRPFSRLYGERFPGTGIGLAIVQKGVERMGGQVGVESAPGQGSRFWFELKKA